MISGFTKDELEGFTVPILRRIALYYNIDIVGRKDVLIERIMNHQDVNEDQAHADVQMSVRIKRIKQFSGEL